MTIYEALKRDHEKVTSLLDDLILKDEKNDDLVELIGKIRDELIPHARAEESVFYNSIRAANAGQDVIMHSFSEHLEAESHLRAIQVKDKVDMEWMNSAKALRSALINHIQEEEEGKVFNLARTLFSEAEAEMMGQAFEALKPKIREQGAMRTSLEMVKNLMPQRFATVFQRYSTI